MIISRTPLRISFFGGGTDYPGWYGEHGGAVLATSIDKYCYLTCRWLPPFFDYKYRIRYYLREEAKTLEDIQHPSVRACLKYLDINDGIDLVHHADLPARSGMGSSSAFTVGLLNTLYAMRHKMMHKRDLSLQAIHIEQKVLEENVGSQDQVTAAFGGFNLIRFGGPQEISVRPVIIAPEKMRDLQQNLMLFFTGQSRTASDVAAEQIKGISKNGEQLRTMAGFVDQAVEILQSGSSSLDEFGALLHDQWQIKRQMSSAITNSQIDDIYATGKAAGATGGKLLGAGGGGFMLFYVKPELQETVKAALSKLLHVPFKFEHLGAQIIYYSHNNHF